MYLFYYGDKFYLDYSELMDDLDIEDPNDLPDDWDVTCFEVEEQPIYQFNPGIIANLVPDRRFSEDGIDKEYDAVVEVIAACVDFGKLNSMLPKLYYPTKESFVVTKQDLILNTGIGRGLLVQKKFSKPFRQCAHTSTDIRTLRCNCCKDCGEILDVLD